MPSGKQILTEGDQRGKHRHRADRADAFAGSLMARAAELKLPALFQRSCHDAVLQVLDRSGVSVVVVENAMLSDDELESVLRFRLAQYLAVGFADAHSLFEAGVEHEPLSSVSPTDLHVLAGSARDGEILCTMALRGLRVAADQPMRSRDRQSFPVEEMHGIGIYDRLIDLPEVPVARVREMGRYVKNQRHMLDELGLRAPIEVCLAVFRTLVGPLRSRVDAVLTEVEEGVAKRNLDFFDIPTALIRGTVSYEGPSWLCGHQGRTFYPLAFSVADMVAHALPRAAAIERALARPGRDGVRELLALRRMSAPMRSRFEPPAGLPPLAQLRVPHADLPMPARAELRRRGELLRRVSPFGSLTNAEATVLRTLMSTSEPCEGEVIVRQGDRADALFVVEKGEAEAVATDGGGRRWSLGRLGAGSCFGEIALVLGMPHTAAVIARTPMRLLRLPADAYRRYLATIDEVESAFLIMAVDRLAAT